MEYIFCFLIDFNFDLYAHFTPNIQRCILISFSSYGMHYNWVVLLLLISLFFPLFLILFNNLYTFIFIFDWQFIFVSYLYMIYFPKLFFVRWLHCVLWKDFAQHCVCGHNVSLGCLFEWLAKFHITWFL